MLQFINNLPPHVVGVLASGEVTKEDMEKVLIPKLEELRQRQDKLNYLLVLETGVQNFTLAAWWNDFKLGISNFTKWNRIAIVSDQKGVEWFTNLFSYLIPGRAKGFPLNQLDQAVSWVSSSGENL